MKLYTTTTGFVVNTDAIKFITANPSNANHSLIYLEANGTPVTVPVTNTVANVKTAIEALADLPTQTFNEDVLISSGSDLIFAGSTGQNKIKMSDNLANALSIAEGSTDYLTFVTTNSSEGITVQQHLTMADAKNIVLDSTTGTKIGTATTQKLGFYNATPIAQRSGAAQAAVVGTAATNSSPYGYSQAQADAIVTLLNEIRTTLVNLGLMKGSA